MATESSKDLTFFFSRSPKTSKREREEDDTSSSRKQLKSSPPVSLDDFRRLVDLSSLTSVADIGLRFDQLAQALLHDYRIVLTHEGKTTEFEILELEFYLQKPGCHADPFTHSSQEQGRPLQWYFHRAPRFPNQISDGKLPEYRSGTRKGLDLTFGGPVTDKPVEKPIRGGILIRTVRNMSAATKPVVSGPSLTVDEILRLSGVSDIVDLVTGKWGDDISALPKSSSSDVQPNGTRLYLQPAMDRAEPPPKIFQSPRVGLDLSNPQTTESHPRVLFVTKPYRYFTRPRLYTAKGRMQTFLGIYQSCLEADKPKSDKELTKLVANLSGMSEQTVANYLAHYKAGLTSGKLSTFIGPAGKGTSSSTSAYLKMAGTLARVQQ